MAEVVNGAISGTCPIRALSKRNLRSKAIANARQPPVGGWQSRGAFDQGFSKDCKRQFRAA